VKALTSIVRSRDGLESFGVRALRRGTEIDDDLARPSPRRMLQG
jgi:hypothetical protein